MQLLPIIAVGLFIFLFLLGVLLYLIFKPEKKNTKVQKRCPGCGQILEENWNRCPFCIDTPADDIQEVSASVPPIAWLVVRRGEYRGKMYVLSSERFSIGSNNKCSLVLNANHVAREQGAIQLRDNEFVYSQTAPGRHTYINNSSVRKSYTLSDGDIIRFGDSTEYIFKMIV